ncbi:hypothetical protein AAF712_003206 [Marasmius tenuissimus]|uniref:MFS general substrate transporter n=1 Tax=Marasmius tenuissimus TaxID=585030 RepID=A0ABR3A7G9_9AGAR
MASEKSDTTRGEETVSGLERADTPSSLSGDQERRLLRKLDLRLLPGLVILYLLSFLDRSNVANARLEGLTDDLHMTGNQYLTSLTLYFVGYVLFEIPCNIILKLTTPKIWLPTLTLLWGVVATLMGLPQNMAGFFVVRFFLGVTESGLFPGVVYYLTGAFGGILAFGIGKMAGVADLRGWRWIFIIEGLVTVVVSLAAYLFIHNYPSTATFLTPKERDTIEHRLTADSDATAAESFNWENVSKCLKDPKCWLYGLSFHTLSLPLYTLSLFLPTIIKDLGYTAANAQLLSVPPYALATTLTLLVAIYSQRFSLRAPFMIGSSIFAMIGYIILMTNKNPTQRPGVSYVGTFFAAGGIYPATALALSWPAMNVAGQTKRATACAMQISVGNLGAVLGTQLYRPITSPRYLLGHGFALGYLAANAVVTATLWIILRKENRRKAELLASGARDGKGKESEPMKGDEDPRWKFHL